MAERWDGTIWAVQDVPDPGGRTEFEDATLDAVSCTFATACITVGSFGPIGDVNLVLVDRRKRDRWTIQRTPSVPGSSDQFVTDALESISCTSATSCMSVGTTGDTSGTALAERWNGSTWTVEMTATPPRATAHSGGQLYGVSCTSATACVAVGDYSDRNGTDFLLAERWDGRQWSFEPTPRARGASPSGGGVSCTSPIFCMLVTGRRTERWDGTRWTIVPTPNGTQLNAVSCTSPTHCIAVGRIRLHRSAVLPDLVEVWNGDAWKVQPTPTRAGTSDAFLTAIACPSRTACWAVGSSTVRTSGSGTRQHALAERWNGKRWKVLPTPSSRVSILSGVSCISARDCVAVGSGGGTANGGYGVVAEGYP